MYHAAQFMERYGYTPGEKSARDTAWWQDSVQALQLEKAKEFYEDFDMPDLLNLCATGEAYNENSADTTRRSSSRTKASASTTSN